MEFNLIELKTFDLGTDYISDIKRIIVKSRYKKYNDSVDIISEL